VLEGHGVGLNFAVGTVWRVFRHETLPEWVKSHTTGTDAADKATDLRAAISSVASDLDRLAAGADQTSAEIFEALKILLEDEELFGQAQENLLEGWSAAGAFGMAVNTFCELLSGDSTLEERVADLQDLSRRVQAKLAGISLTLDLPATGEIILVAEDFSPADTAQFTAAVVGVITIGGGPTSHTSIICRAKGIAAVVAATAASDLQNGQQVLVDPVGDRVVVGGNANQATRAIEFKAGNSEPVITVRANVGNLTDAAAAARTSAQGVGLFRTELLYLNEKLQPSVQRQTTAYAEIFAASPAGPVVVRTIDVASDKPVAFLPLTHETTLAPESLGYRVLQEHREFIQSQLESIETARRQTGREVWVMAPMISSAAEAKDFCDLARSIGDFKVGIMVETPSIASEINRLEGIVDFVSIGTNDLSQYLFSVDRLNPAHGKLLSPWQPKLISTIAQIAKDALAGAIAVGVCGEAASDPLFAIVLAGLGVTSVSASPSQVDSVRDALASVDIETAKMLAARALAANSPESAKAQVLAALED